MSKFVKRDFTLMKEYLQYNYSDYLEIPRVEDKIRDFCSKEKIDIFSRKRDHETVMWRYSIMMVLILNGYTQKLIGLFLDRDHATVIHGVKVFNDELNGFGEGIEPKLISILIYLKDFVVP